MSWSDFAWLILITTGIHRIWNAEDIFSPVRTWIKKSTRFLWIQKMLTCAPCNAFWIALGVSFIFYYQAQLPPITWVFLWALAAYGPVRALWAIPGLLSKKQAPPAGIPIKPGQTVTTKLTAEQARAFRGTGVFPMPAGDKTEVLKEGVSP